LDSVEQPKAVLRLMFEYEGTKVHLLSSQIVTMRLPPSIAIDPEREQAGFWYELRDGDDHTLYRRLIETPVRFDAEVFSDEEKPSIMRKEVSSPHGAFVLLVPATPNADSVVLFSSSIRPRTAAFAAKEFARIKLPKP
jgi:hypothetical protein